ncbi:cell division protein FtsK [Streptomyces sp. NPDC002867]
MKTDPTTVLRSIAAQALHHGAHVDFLDLDRRRPSHRWATSLPGALVHSRVEDVEKFLVGMLDRLRSEHGEVADDWSQRRIIVIEHGERLLDALRHHFGQTNADTQLDEAPAVEALSILLEVGHHSGIQIVAGNTRGLPPYLGTHARDGFPVRVLAYAGDTMWTRIAPEVWPVPPYSVIPGRMHAVHEGSARRMQALYLSESQARAWARRSVPKEYR